MDILATKNLWLMNMRFNRSFHQNGVPPHGHLTFGIPIGGLDDWFGTAYHPHEILPFGQRDGIDGVSQAGFKAQTITIDLNYLTALAHAYNFALPDTFVQPDNNTRIRYSASARLVRQNLRKLFADTDGLVLMSDDEDELILALINSATNELLMKDRSSIRTRSKSLRRALNFIHEHADKSITVRDICTQNGISLRTLHRAFRERFGIGPKAYLLRRRLSGVHKELISSGAHTSITTVAHRWGFTHLGQFACDYKAVFGELPSTTRNRLVDRRRK